MCSGINENDLVTFSDGLKVLIMEKYHYDNDEYLLVKQVNSAETITIGKSFFLKVISSEEGVECEYVKDDELIYSLMDQMRRRSTDRDNIHEGRL